LRYWDCTVVRKCGRVFLLLISCGRPLAGTRRRSGPEGGAVPGQKGKKCSSEGPPWRRRKKKGFAYEIKAPLPGMQKDGAHVTTCHVSHHAIRNERSSRPSTQQYEKSKHRIANRHEIGGGFLLLSRYKLLLEIPGRKATGSGKTTSGNRQGSTKMAPD